MFRILKIAKKVFYLLVFLFLFIFIFSRGANVSEENLEYGVTFSQKQALNLGLDWKKVYLSIFDDLGVKKIRIPAYWDEVEKNKGEFFWQDLDWQIQEAEKRKAEVILSVGSRLPRWPECHLPDWAKEITEGQKEKEVFEYIGKTINRYRNYKSIIAWQVENEPFLSHFGDCPDLNKDFLDMEIALVRKLDSRPIVITDSGELSLWVPAARRADIFGTTMYRDTYSQTLKRYIHYPITPRFFHFKKNITDLFSEPKKWVVIELQAEPWGPIPFQEMSQEERSRTMDLEKFKAIIDFSSKTGFGEFYLWGVEWWYWEKENNNPQLWQEAKKLFD